MECKLNQPVQKDALADMLEVLRSGFADRRNEFYKVLSDMILSEKFTEIQVKRGVREVIKTCPYNHLSISAVFQACKNSPSERFVEYQRETPSGGMQNVTTIESVYLSDLSMFGRDENRVKFIRYIEE